jgi:hypothetical protein
MKTEERAVCTLCGEVITTTNGGRSVGGVFVSFERLLDLHMEQRHANVCVLPQRGEVLRQAA